MSTSYDVVLMFGTILGLYGIVQAMRRAHYHAGLAMVVGGACIGLWNTNHILTSPIDIPWPGLLLLAIVPLGYMLMGIMHLFDAFYGED